MSNSSENDELEESFDEFLYEYLERKPTMKIFYILSVILMCSFGLIANSIIIYMKLRNFRNRSSFDLITANIALGLNFLSIRFILVMIEETTHDFINLPFCYATRLSVDLAMPIIITSLLALMILIKYYPNMSKEIELKIVAGILIYAAIISLPIYNIQIYEHNSWKIPHKICLLHFNDDLGLKKYLARLWISIGLKIFLPLLITIVFFISLAFNFSIGQYRNLWIYSIIVSIYYFIMSLTSVLTPLISIHLQIDIGSRFMVYVSFNILCLIVAISPVVLWYFDRDFYQETVEYLAYKLGIERNNNGEFNEIVFDQKNLQNVDIA